VGTRLEGWESRLTAIIEDARPFSYGDADCCLFASRCVLAMTGVDHAARFRYADAWGATRILRAHGGLEGLATMLLGPSKPPRQAARGDVVLIEAPLRTLGICLGHVVAAQGLDGVVYRPLADATKAWGV